MAVVLLALCASAAAHAAMPLADWRNEITALRTKSENDSPQAYVEAKLLQKEMPAGATLADRAWMLNQLSRIELHLALIPESVRHSAEAKVIAIQSNDADGQIEADLNIALGAINQGRLDDMIAATQDGMSLLETVRRDDLRAEMMFQAAMMYLRFGQLEEAITVAMQALEVANNIDDQRGRAYAEQSMGVVYIQSGRYADARGHYLNMQGAARQAHHTLLEAAALLGLSTAADGMGDKKEAERLNNQALELFRRVGAPFYLSHAQHLLADIYLRNKQPEKALPLFDDNAKIYEAHENPIGLWWTLQARSHASQAMGRLDKARGDAERSYALAQNIGFNVYMGGSAQRLADVIAAQGDYMGAYRWSAEAAALKEKSDLEKSGKRVLDLAKRFREESKQRRIDELNHHNERQHAQQRQMQIGLAAMLSLLAVTMFFLLRLRKSREEIRSLNVGLEQRVMERTEELLDSRQSLSEAQRIAHVGSWEYDIASDIHIWSDELFRIYEIDPVDEGASYDGCMNATHPDDRDAIARAYLNSMETGKSYESEHRLLMADGRIKYVHERCEMVCGPDGALLRAVGMMQDITERKQAEQKLKEALEFSEGVVNAIPDILFEMDGNGRYLNVWTQNPELLATQKEMLLGKTVGEVLSPENAAIAMESIREADEKGISTGKVMRIDLPQGTFWFEHSLAKKVTQTPDDATFIVLSRDITERKQLENALAAREQEFRSLAESSPDFIVRYDREVRHCYLNNNLIRKLGLSDMREVLGKRPSEVWTDGRFSDIEEAAARAIESGEIEGFEMGVPDGNLGMRHTQVSVVPERDASGNVIGVISFGRDVTAYRVAEQKLKEALEFNEGVINAIPDLLFEMDKDGRYLNLWTHTPELLAAQKEVLLGNTVRDMLAPESAAVMMEALREAGENGVSFGKVIHIDLPEGISWFELSVSMKPGSTPSDGTFMVLSRDITKRKRMEAELMASRNFLDTVIESVSDPIFVKDKQHRWTLLNDACCAFSGYTREMLIGKSDYDIFPKEQADEFWEKDQLVFDSGEVNLNEECFTTASGEVHYIQTKKTPFISADGQQMLVGVIRDITDLKRYEAAREAALAEVLRLANLRSEFIAHMSHELRTPLNGILGYAQMLGRDGKLDEKQLASMDVIRQSGEHLLALIDDILDLARIESGKLELGMSDIPLARFLNVVAGIVGVRAKQKQIEFVCEFASDLPEGIRGDEKRLRQVLLNLLSNAVKFTDRGRVTLSVSRVASSRLAFAVKDTGIGIESSERETIFQSFEQVSDTQHRQGGTGLGLSISRQLVRLMGGDIEVKSRPGEGSTFRFELELPEVSIESDVLRMPVADTQQVEPEGENEAVEPLIAPPQAELQALHRLALLGNMRDIVDYAERIVGIDLRYRPFAGHLKRLANSYQSKAIRAFVEEHLI